MNNPSLLVFQLTAPLREPTVAFMCYNIADPVSTHGSLAGADLNFFQFCDGILCFNSRLPCGSRPIYHAVHDYSVVSTHGSLAGADVGIPWKHCASQCFNSRLPCGSRHGLPVVSTPFRRFQLTAPLREPTVSDIVLSYILRVSTHGSLAGADNI